MKKTVNKENQEFYEELVKSVEDDFETRRKERLYLERQWELNMNFLVGNQYCDIGSKGDIVGEKSEFFWQKRDVFNHIAPIIETRMAKFANLSPVLAVRPKSDDDSDVQSADLAEKLLSYVVEKEELLSTVKKVTEWSETCGTGFYKIVWNNDGGNVVGSVDGKTVYEGEAEVLAVSPFEIFPDNLMAGGVENCGSIIHAKAVPVAEVRRKYGIDVKGEKINVFNLAKTGSGYARESKKTLDNAVVVIEKYELPTDGYPNGRLITVASGKLLYYGELPYLNGKNGSRTYPFVKQECVKTAGCFFGISTIERLIPVQRAYNAVRNRKQEFLNRLSMGVMTVEDGSVDVDDLAEEGLSPGKILVYRQGGKAPELMNEFTMPAEFKEEEENLINEFVRISGVADATSSSTRSLLTSGTALEILAEQDNERMASSAEVIRRCFLNMAKQILRLYAQFSAGIKAVRVNSASGKYATYYIGKSAFTSDDVYLENENELLYNRRQKKEMIINLYKNGLLTDEDGKVRQETKEKLLTLLGYKDLDFRKGASRLHEQKAQNENEKIRKLGLDIEEIDDDAIHIDEHTRYILSEYAELSGEEKARLFAHLKAHKDRFKILSAEKNGEKTAENIR